MQRKKSRSGTLRAPACALAVGLLVLSPVGAQVPAATPVPAFSPDEVAQAVAASPVVIAGWLEAVPAHLPPGAGGNRLRPPEDLTVAVDRIIRGIASRPRIAIRLTGLPPLSPADIGRYFIFFLESTGSPYTSAPAAGFGCVPAAPTRAAGATPLATVEAMVGAALLSPNSRASGRDVLIMMFLEGDRSRSPLLTEAFEAELQSPNSQARGMAIAALVARGSATGLRAAATYVFEPLARWDLVTNALAALATPQAARILAVEAASGSQLLMREVALEKLGETRTPQALPVLAAALRSRTGQLRLAAVRGLENLRTPAAVGLLGAALGDPSEQVRFNAYCSLSAIKEGIPGISLDRDDFRRNEASYIRQWKQWARDHSTGGGD